MYTNCIHLTQIQSSNIITKDINYRYRVCMDEVYHHRFIGVFDQQLFGFQGSLKQKKNISTKPQSRCDRNDYPANYLLNIIAYRCIYLFDLQFSDGGVAGLLHSFEPILQLSPLPLWDRCDINCLRCITHRT